MTPIAPLITTFLQQRLPVEQGASPHTCDSYAYAFQLLFAFASDRLRVAPSNLCLEQIDADLTLDFLEYIQEVRGNSPRTRNLRLVAIKSFMRFVEHQVPSALEQVRRVLAIPTQKTESRLVRHLNLEETQAILDAPDPTTRYGVRDRAMLYLGFTAGLRVSELVGLHCDDLAFAGRYVDLRVRGKGRKERALKLWKEVADSLRAWLALRGEAPVPELFLNARSQPMSRSGFEYVLRKHVTAAGSECPSLDDKRISPHVLRHTCAINTLRATGDIRKVALWLGHSSQKSTEIYLDADPTEKLHIIETITPPMLRRGEFRPADKLIAALTKGQLC